MSLSRTAPDASFNNIGAMDGSLIIVGDLSVNGQIFTSGGLVGAGGAGGAGGGSGTDASFNVIDEFLDGSGVTFLTDVSFNETIDVSNSIITKKIFGSTIDNVLSSETVEYTIGVNQNRFTFDSAIQPSLNLYRGSTYKFDQSSSEILNFVYVDTPGTNGEISYRPALISSEPGRSFYLNQAVGDHYDTQHYERGVSTFTLEVKD